MTIRTEAQLQAQFADNVNGDIGANDLLDLLDTHFQDRVVRIEADSFELQSGPNRPALGVINATSYLAFGVNDVLTFHMTLPPEIDTDSDINISVDVAPTAAEIGSLVSWELSYLFMNGVPKTIDTIDGVLTQVDVAVGPTQWLTQAFVFTIPGASVPAVLHELNFRLKRAISANDGADVAVHHVYATVTTKPPGAS